MKNEFKRYIQKELTTIKEFESITPEYIKIRKIVNDSYSPYDFIFTVKDKTLYLCEVKTRDCNHNDYPDTILELNKINDIMEEVKRLTSINNDPSRKIKAAFLVKFNDGMYLFDLTKSPFTVNITYCPYSTAGDSSRFIYKKTAHFVVSRAKKIY